LADSELEQLRDQLYRLAEVVVEAYESETVNGRRDMALLEQMPPSHREIVEERAAMLEFDAHMSRYRATRAALASHLKLQSRSTTRAGRK
jgi:hypothetical protein